MRIFYNFGKLIILLLIVWLVILLFLLGGPLSRTSEDDALAKKLSEVQTENRALTRERDKLARQIRDMSSNRRPEGAAVVASVVPADDNGQADIPFEESKFTDSTCEPSLAYEQYRRRAVRDTKELTNFIQSQLDKLLASSNKITESNINYVKEEVRSHGHAILVDIQKMKENDGFESWREQEAESLSNLVQQRLTKLQNPTNCDTAKKLLCNLNKGCGYGCQIHHALYCFITAYGSERTLILKSSGWRYNKKGFEEEFVVRNDRPCGSTIGPIIASKVGIRTVDLGIPSLSMHSIRETMGCADVITNIKLFQQFYNDFGALDSKCDF